MIESDVSMLMDGKVMRTFPYRKLSMKDVVLSRRAGIMFCTRFGRRLYPEELDDIVKLNKILKGGDFDEKV